jgi:hypothetical protein
LTISGTLLRVEVAFASGSPLPAQPQKFQLFVGAASREIITNTNNQSPYRIASHDLSYSACPCSRHHAHHQAVMAEPQR